MKNLLILGAGTAGTMMANKMVDALDEEWTITVIDRDDVHIYQPGLLLLPFGSYEEHELIKPRGGLLHPDVNYVIGTIDRLDPDEELVTLEDGQSFTYDVLFVATGSHIRPEETEGLAGELWMQDVFDFYTLEGASALKRRLAGWTGGRILINVVDMPIKCPVAPLEFAFLLEAFLTEQGTRDATEIVYVTPLDGAFTKPKASEALGSMMEERGIEVVSNFNASAVDNEQHLLRSWDGREEAFDLLVTVPLHTGAKAIMDSKLGDQLGFVPTDKHTLQSKDYDNVFAVGDATDLPASKAGAVAHFEGDVLFENVLRYIDGRPLLPEFDGHANCFIETGYGKAMLIDFNYETEPLPGRFPLPGIGPFTLLEESHVNHWGKLGFKWVYWNVLVKGDELPLDHRMMTAGKWS